MERGKDTGPDRTAREHKDGHFPRWRSPGEGTTKLKYEILARQQEKGVSE